MTVSCCYRLAITDNVNREVFIYSPLIKSMLFAAVAIGALVAFPPVTWLLQNIGSRSVFGLLGFVSAISTALVPTAARAGICFFLARTAMGMRRGTRADALIRYFIVRIFRMVNRKAIENPSTECAVKIQNLLY
jgi:hypothetical protein